MADTFDTGFAGHADVTGVIDATAAAEVVVEGAKFLALIPDPTVNTVAATKGASPDFDRIPPATAKLLRDEFALFMAAMAAAPAA